MTISPANERVKFQIGDVIVHWTYGLGTVVGIDQKDIGGIAQQFYIVEVGLLKIWVPVELAEVSAIRFPTESSQFKANLDILRTLGEQLPEHQFKRKIELRDRMQQRTLVDLCHVIRDLTDRSHQHSLNQNDSSVLFRAEEHLLDEWVISLGAERSDALGELKEYLRGDTRTNESISKGFEQVPQ